MHSKEHGLTVGELTMTIGVLIVAGLIWTTISKKEDSKDLSNNYVQYKLAKSHTDSQSNPYQIIINKREI